MSRNSPSVSTVAIESEINRDNGNPVKEAKQGQIAVQKEHFKEIIEVILNPDIVRSDTKRNRTSLIFEKNIGDRYFVIKEIRQVAKERKKIGWCCNPFI